MSLKYISINYIVKYLVLFLLKIKIKKLVLFNYIMDLLYYIKC